MADTKGTPPSKPTRRSRDKAKRTTSATNKKDSGKDEKAADAERSASAGPATATTSQIDALQHRLQQIQVGYVARIQNGQNRLRRDHQNATEEFLTEVAKRYESVAGQQNKAYNTYLQTVGTLSTEDHSDGQLADSVTRYYTAIQELTGTDPDQRKAVEDLYQQFLADLEAASGAKETIDELSRDFVNRLDQRLRNPDASARAIEASRSYVAALQAHHAKVQEGASRALEDYVNAIAASWKDEKGDGRVSKASDRFESATEAAWKELRDLYRSGAGEATQAVTAALEEHRSTGST